MELVCNFQSFSHFHYTSQQWFNSGGTSKHKRGPKTKLNNEEESQMVHYLQECWEMGIPQEKKCFAEQVAHYLESHDFDNTFPNKILG